MRFGAILLVASLGTLCFAGGALAQTNTPNAESFLPKGSVTDAVYVQIEPDPAFDDYSRRFREAREKNPEWFREYSRKHQDAEHAPYDENFGVKKEEYERFSQPMNHFREVKRKEIKIRRSNQSGHPQLDFVGDDLLLTQLVLNPEEGTAKTPTDELSKLEFIDLKTASVPPGRHRGAFFRTPDAKIISNKRRESVVVGELKDKNSGIIHYSVSTPGQVKMAYIQFAK